MNNTVLIELSFTKLSVIYLLIEHAKGVWNGSKAFSTPHNNFVNKADFL